MGMCCQSFFGGGAVPPMVWNLSATFCMRSRHGKTCIQSGRRCTVLRKFFWSVSVVFAYLNLPNKTVRCSSAQVARPFGEQDLPSDALGDFRSLVDVPADAPAAPRPVDLPPPPAPAPGPPGPVLPSPPGPPPAPAPQVKREVSDSDTDVEIVNIRPAPKKSRRAVQVKREGHSSQASASLPLRQPDPVRRAPAGRPLYCMQGHDLVLMTLPQSVVLNAKQISHLAATCDICSRQCTTDTYRCDACDWDVCPHYARAQPTSER